MINPDSSSGSFILFLLSDFVFCFLFFYFSWLIKFLRLHIINFIYVVSISSTRWLKIGWKGVYHSHKDRQGFSTHGHVYFGILHLFGTLYLVVFSFCHQDEGKLFIKQNLFDFSEIWCLSNTINMLH